MGWEHTAQTGIRWVSEKYVLIYLCIGPTPRTVVFPFSFHVYLHFLQLHVIVLTISIVRVGSGRAFVSFHSAERCTKYKAINNVYVCLLYIFSRGNKTTYKSEWEKQHRDIVCCANVWCMVGRVHKCFLAVLPSHTIFSSFIFHCAQTNKYDWGRCGWITKANVSGDIHLVCLTL